MGTTKKNKIYIDIMGQSLKKFFRDALRISLSNPSQTGFFLKTLWHQKKASRTRLKWEKQKIHVPPIMVYSITDRCNLHCKGCYNQSLRNSGSEELDQDKMKGVISEAKELGISFIVLAGGEPLVRPEILEITAGFPEIIFLLFTNGLLLEGDIFNKFSRQKNVIPIISLEGYRQETDERRGEGVYEIMQKIIKKLRNRKAFFGASLTVTRQNFDTIINHRFIEGMVKLGCRVFFLPEYTAIRGGTEDWVPTQGQRATIPEIMNAFRNQFPAIFIALPSDEEEFGGCLSAGRGFIHVSAEGNVEPCPFAPYSDTNLKQSTLKDSLQSELLRAIRENHDQLHEAEGGCALWAKREWVQSLLNNNRASAGN